MADTITTLTNFINSPPGQLTAGGVVAGVVWKTFERVESVLTDRTKLEIAVWLVGLETANKVRPWPQTFGTLMDKVFGDRHPSLKGLGRSFLVTLSTYYVVIALILIVLPEQFMLLARLLPKDTSKLSAIIIVAIGGFVAAILFSLFMAIPDYLTIISLRRAISWTLTKRVNSSQGIPVLVSVLLPLFYSVVLVLVFDWEEWEGLHLMLAPQFQPQWYQRDMSYWTFVRTALIHASVSTWIETLVVGFPLFLCSMWLWLYASSGFILRAAHRFDIGFGWFNRTFDIEKKPLQAIGLVAGCIVALVYWTFALIRHFV